MPVSGASGHRPRVLLLIKGLGLGGAERLLVDVVGARDPTRFDYEVAYVLADQDALVPAMEVAGVPVHALGASASADLRWTARTAPAPRPRPLRPAPLPPALHRGVRAPRRPHRGAAHADRRSSTPSTACGTRQRCSPRPSTGPPWAPTGRSSWCRGRHATPCLGHCAATRVSWYTAWTAPDSPSHADRRATVRGEVRAELGVGDDEVLALTVANLRSEKGYDVLLEAARFSVAAGAPVRFVSVGRGPLEAELATAARRPWARWAFRLPRHAHRHGPSHGRCRRLRPPVAPRGAARRPHGGHERRVCPSWPPSSAACPMWSPTTSRGCSSPLVVPTLLADAVGRVAGDATLRCAPGRGIPGPQRGVRRARRGAGHRGDLRRGPRPPEAAVSTAGQVSGNERPGDIPLVLHVIPTATARGAQREARALATRLDLPGARRHRLLSLFAGQEQVPVDLALDHPGGDRPAEGFDPRLVARLRAALRRTSAHRGGGPRRRPAQVPGARPCSGTRTAAGVLRHRHLRARGEPDAGGVVAGPGAARRGRGRRRRRGARPVPEPSARARGPVAARPQRTRPRTVPPGRGPPRRRGSRGADRDGAALPVPVLAFVGALTAGKRPDRFVEVVAALRRRGLQACARSPAATGRSRPELSGPAAEAGVEMLGSRD